jgi:hypothetical protein
VLVAQIVAAEHWRLPTGKMAASLSQTAYLQSIWPKEKYERLQKIVKDRTKCEIKSFQGTYRGESFEIK